MRLGSLVVVLWLVIGVIACFQRGYVTANDTTCAHAGTVAVSVIAGPLNYLGANPKVHNCKFAEPSK